MALHELSADSQAILLLCASLGRRGQDRTAPLGAAEYHKLAQWLHGRELRPADLLANLSTFENDLPLERRRIEALLERGAALALAVESWSNRGLWILSRGDDAYPQRLRTRLGRLAPPVLFGAGTQSLLDDAALAVVGSRDAGEAALDFARSLAERCAVEKLAVISGAARGVDSEAIATVLDSGGTAAGVLAESLQKAAVAGKYRAALRDGRLALVTAYDPGTGFSIGNAMGRNKYIYALSSYAVVVDSALQGGTWSGAVENLERGWVPLFVRADEPLAPGNRALLERGAIAITQQVVRDELSLTDWLQRQAASTPHNHFVATGSWLGS